MSANDPRPSDDTAAFEIRAGSFSLPVLRLFTASVEALGPGLEERVAQAPDFFRNTPVVLDLGALDPADGLEELPLLLGLLRGFGMVPVAVRGGSPAQVQAAQGMDLALLPEGTSRPASGKEAGDSTRPEPAPAPRRAPESSPPPKSRPAPGARTLVIDRPVRSGQRVYARGGDVVVLAQVGSGAEVMADGHVHIYGSLRGRALAGVRGDTEARIFCQSLDPELVAVAGRYVVNERIDAARLRKPAQIYLREGRLHIDPLG
jgi:septum site-determining protein MinC